MSAADITAVLGRYADIYRAIQDRMAPGGDLGADSPYQTERQHYRDGTWPAERLAVHRRILAAAREQQEHKPRHGRAVLVTAGPPGAGKSSGLRLLDDLRGKPTSLGAAVAAAQHAPLSDYVTVDPDEFKRALLLDPATRPNLPEHALRLPGGARIAPAEMATLIHAESQHLANQLALWARENGYNLVYDTSLRTLDRQLALLQDLHERGYHHRTLISVEVPLQTSLLGNAIRWLEGRTAYDAGADQYGGRMVPEHHIRDLYAGHDDDYSTSRLNARHLAAAGLVTDVVEVDRHRDHLPDGEARATASTYSLNADTTIHICRWESEAAADTVGRSSADRLRDARRDALDAMHLDQPTTPTEHPRGLRPPIDVIHVVNETVDSRTQHHETGAAAGQ